MALFLQKGMYQLLKRNCSIRHIVFDIWSLQKAPYFVEICF